MSSLVRIPIVERLMTELNQLTHPEHLFNDWVEYDLKPLLVPAPRDRNKSAIKAAYQTIKRDLL
eukprot:Awhi_evm1s4007